MNSKESREARDESQAIHFALLEQLDLYSAHKPFRKPTWRPNQRRNKNIKTILGEASRREAASAAATPAENNSGAATPFGDTDTAATPATTAAMETSDAGNGASQPNLAQASRSLSKLVLEKNLARSTDAAAVEAGNSNNNATATEGTASTAPSATYTNVESAPSLAPQKRYCDITGLPARYTDPKSRLRYYNKEVYSLVRSLPQGAAEQFLEARGAQVILK